MFVPVPQCQPSGWPTHAAESPVLSVAAESVPVSADRAPARSPTQSPQGQ